MYAYIQRYMQARVFKSAPCKGSRDLMEMSSHWSMGPNSRELDPNQILCSSCRTSVFVVFQASMRRVREFCKVLRVEPVAATAQILRTFLLSFSPNFVFCCGISGPQRYHLLSRDACHTTPVALCFVGGGVGIVLYGASH